MALNKTQLKKIEALKKKLHNASDDLDAFINRGDLDYHDTSELSGISYTVQNFAARIESFINRTTK